MNKAQIEAATLIKGLPMLVAAGGCKPRLLVSCGFPMVLFGSRSQRQERQSLEPYMRFRLAGTVNPPQADCKHANVER
jgi:hypothetical protein